MNNLPYSLPNPFKEFFRQPPAPKPVFQFKFIPTFLVALAFSVLGDSLLTMSQHGFSVELFYRVFALPFIVLALKFWYDREHVIEAVKDRKDYVESLEIENRVLSTLMNKVDKDILQKHGMYFEINKETPKS